MVTVGSLVPGGVVSLWMLPLWKKLWDEQMISWLCVPDALQTTLSHYMSMGCLSFLVSKSKSSAPYTLFQLNPLILKLQALGPTGCKITGNQPLSLLKSVAMGIHFFQFAPLCASLSLTPCNISSPHHSSHDHLHISSLFWCGFFYTFICRICSSSLQVGFWYI